MQPSDEELELRVHDALSTEPHLARPDLEVRVANGVVTLTGEVATPERRQLAEETARRVPGVVDVRNRLQVLHMRERSYEVERIPPVEEET